jgi:hypothetical protein
MRFGHVIVVRGGSTRMHPDRFFWTQYHQELALDVEASHARDTLVSVDAVMRRFAGVDGPAAVGAGVGVGVGVGFGFGPRVGAARVAVERRSPRTTAAPIEEVKRTDIPFPPGARAFVY